MDLEATLLKISCLRSTETTCIAMHAPRVTHGKGEYRTRVSNPCVERRTIVITGVRLRDAIARLSGAG